MSCSRCSCRATTSRDEDKLADFEYYDPLTTGDSTLSAVVQAILAAEVGYQDLALDYFRAVDLRRPRRPAPQRLRRRARRVGGRRLDGARVRLRRHARPLRRAHVRPAAARGLAGAVVHAALARHAAGRHAHARSSCGSRAGEGDPLVFSVRGAAVRDRRGRGGRRAARRPGSGDRRAGRRSSSSPTSAARTARCCRHPSRR